MYDYGLVLPSGLAGIAIPIPGMSMAPGGRRDPPLPGLEGRAKDSASAASEAPPPPLLLGESVDPAARGEGKLLIPGSPTPPKREAEPGVRDGVEAASEDEEKPMAAAPAAAGPEDVEMGLLLVNWPEVPPAVPGLRPAHSWIADDTSSLSRVSICKIQRDD
jgi:hypothetical protein